MVGFGKRGREGEEGAETEADAVPTPVPGSQTVSLERMPAAHLAYHWHSASLKTKHPINVVV